MNIIEVSAGHPNRQIQNIGILTYHFSTNYGAILQAYALQEIVKNLGFQCEIIDYRQYPALKAYFKQLFLRKNPVKNLSKVFRFYFFIKRNLGLSRCRYRSRGAIELISQYDAVIVGSDEVWKMDSFRGYDPAFFLGNLPDEIKKISFSASMGSSATFGVREVEVCRHLRRFDFLAVRDDRTQSVLRDECGINSLRSLDPTLLYDNWDPFLLEAGGPVPAASFVLVYGKFVPEELQYIQGLAVRDGLIVVSVGENNPGVDLNLTSAGPREWLALFYRAKRVYTTFFHGAIFSLKFHREVFVFRRADKSYKTDQLVHDLELSVNVSSPASEFSGAGKLYHCKYSRETEVLLERHETDAFCFLTDALTSA